MGEQDSISAIGRPVILKIPLFFNVFSHHPNTAPEILDKLIMVCYTCAIRLKTKRIRILFRGGIHIPNTLLK